jgi:hypothetical protein
MIANLVAGAVAVGAVNRVDERGESEEIVS